jgi:hypothetical protein
MNHKRDHKCRTCKHWGAPLGYDGDELHPCMYPIPSWLPPCTKRAEVGGSYGYIGSYCQAYAYSDRRVTLLNKR